ncbi:MAG: DUF2922 domain-containing protein [Synergistaceae bacterium]|nr:DUF2922 domain-containing protein [Synergistaceae bacterium]
MAAASKLVLTFAGTNKDVSFSYNYANSEAASAKVKALMNGLIANGSIFENPPVSAKSAKIVTTTTTEYDLSA